MSEENAELEEIARSLSELSVDDWVLVKFAGKRNIIYYVGQVIEIKKQEVEIKFCRKSAFFTKKSIFKFPFVDDVSIVSETDIVRLLPNPEIGRRGEISFQMSFTGYTVE